MSSIRVTYTGLISFVVGIISVITGLVFTIIVSRQLTQDEFGMWSLIGVLAGYVFIFGPIVNYWTTRQTARGIDSGKTAVVSSSMFSVIGLFVYFIIAYFVGMQPDVDEEILFFAAILVPIEFFRTVLVAITRGYRPQTEEYSFIVFEIFKIPLALVLIFYLDMGLIGVIITTSIASLVSITVLLIRTYKKIQSKFNVDHFKKWLKLFWVPTYPHLQSILNQTDILIFTVITGSVSGVAYWGASMGVSKIVRHSMKINVALYPKLLSGGKKEFFEENITRVFYFAFPLAAMSFVFSEPALFTLNPLYKVASPVILFMVPMIFLRNLEKIFRGALTGVEKIDMNEKANFKDYLKSKLFFLPTITNIQLCAYLIVLLISLLLLNTSSSNDLDLVIIWSIIALVSQIPSTLYHYVLVRREFSPKIDINTLLKYFFSSVGIFGIAYFVITENIVYNESIYDFMPQFLPVVILSILGYVGITYVIDKKTRKLVSSIIKELKPKIRSGEN